MTNKLVQIDLCSRRARSGPQAPIFWSYLLILTILGYLSARKGAFALSLFLIGWFYSLNIWAFVTLAFRTSP